MAEAQETQEVADNYLPRFFVETLPHILFSTSATSSAPSQDLMHSLSPLPGQSILAHQVAFTAEHQALSIEL